jgi:DNA modification methylase
MWAELKRVIKPRGAIVLFCSQPFTSALVMSNAKQFKYAWVWDKKNASNPQLAKIMPLKNYEDISVFASGRTTYNPQGLKPLGRHRQADKAMEALGHIAQSKSYVQEFTNYPTMILQYSMYEPTLHPTQKPLPLMSYLIRTYTNAGETVLDFCYGSGTTGVAALMEGRHFIGMEKDAGYYALGATRIEQVQPALVEAAD